MLHGNYMIKWHKNLLWTIHAPNGKVLRPYFTSSGEAKQWIDDHELTHKVF